MNRNIGLIAVLLAMVLLSGCNLKRIQLNKRLSHWESMQKKQEDPEKMVEFARKSIYFFLNQAAFQRTKEATITDQERLIYHRRMTSMEVYLISYYARKALDAVERSDPDWKLGESLWIKADTCARGKVPGYPTNFSLVHVQSGYSKLMEDLVLHPEKYAQLARDYPGLMDAMRKMSRFKFLEAQKYLAAQRYDRALDNYLEVFFQDVDNFPAADEVVRRLTGMGIKQTVAHRFMQHRYQQTFESDRNQAYNLMSAALNKIAEEQGEDIADSTLTKTATDVAQNLNISPEQNLDFYYYMRAYNNGNLPEYLRMWRHVVLEGTKPLRAQYSE